MDHHKIDVCPQEVAADFHRQVHVVSILKDDYLVVEGLELSVII